MRKILTIFFVLFLCFNFASCMSTNVTTQIIDIDENPDSEFVIDAMWLKEPIEAKFVLEKSTGRQDTYKVEKAETLQFFTINPKDKIRVRFNAKELAHKLFMNEIDFNCVGPRFSSGWGCIWNVNGFKGKSRKIVLTKNGRRYSVESKTYKDTK